MRGHWITRAVLWVSWGIVAAACSSEAAPSSHLDDSGTDSGADGAVDGAVPGTEYCPAMCPPEHANECCQLPCADACEDQCENSIAGKCGELYAAYAKCGADNPHLITGCPPWAAGTCASLRQEYFDCYDSR